MGLGDVLSSTKDPTAILIGEVNRFGPDAPESFRYVPQAYPLATGNVPPAVAVTAAMLLVRRAQDAAVKFGDQGSRDLLREAGKANANPIPYVNANLPKVTEQIKAYADSLGLGASRLSVVGKVSGYLKQPLVLAAVGAGALWLFMRKKKGGR